ncbi:methyltransferase domain-containing protein [Candidatus Saccharibacteria bacterium]|nr:methyltransferase domain-containing protein [Candidatus Saccharibacteria bacterium]
MEDTNKKTIDAYEVSIDQYILNTPNKRGAVVEAWIDKAIKGLAQDAQILEIGSGYGRDATYIEDKGFHVEKTDATQGFVDILVGKDPTSHTLNIVTDEIASTYDLIIANAVLLHLNDEQTREATKKIYNALHSQGTFAFTLKQGEGSAWQTNKDMAPRFFNYWHKKDVVKILSDTGFTSFDAWVDETDSPSAIWIMVVARKA